MTDKNETFDYSLELSLPRNTKNPFNRKFFDNFHREFLLNIKHYLNEIDKRIRNNDVCKITLNENLYVDYVSVRFKIFSEIIEESSVALIKLFVKKLDKFNYKKLNNNELKYSEIFFKHNINLLIKRCLEILENGARLMKKQDYYKNDTRLWVEAALVTITKKNCELLNIKLNEYNATGSSHFKNYFKIFNPKFPYYHIIATMAGIVVIISLFFTVYEVFIKDENNTRTRPQNYPELVLLENPSVESARIKFSMKPMGRFWIDLDNTYDSVIKIKEKDIDWDEEYLEKYSEYYSKYDSILPYESNFMEGTAEYSFGLKLKNVGKASAEILFSLVTCYGITEPVIRTKLLSGFNKDDVSFSYAIKDPSQKTSVEPDSVITVPFSMQEIYAEKGGSIIHFYIFYRDAVRNYYDLYVLAWFKTRDYKFSTRTEETPIIDDSVDYADNELKIICSPRKPRIDDIFNFINFSPDHYFYDNDEVDQMRSFYETYLKKK
jgi:hypothetical protein